MISAADREILRRTLLPPSPDEVTGLHAFVGWFMNMTPLPKQVLFHHAPQRNRVLIGGVGGGKTSVVAMSAAAHCATIPHFKFLNTAPTAFQAKLMYDWLAERIEANERLKRLVSDMKTRPYPMIEWVTGAKMEFITAGIEARNIRGTEYDWANYDEAAFDPRLEASLVAISTRLRGLRPDGTPRMAILSLSSSPTDNPTIREWWERGDDPNHPAYKPDEFLALRVTIFENIYLPPEQVQKIVETIPEEVRDVELGGMLPFGLGTEFTRDQLDLIFEPDWNDRVQQALEDRTEGYAIVHKGHHGVVRYMEPPQPGRIYVLGGDPGTGNVPRQNAGCVMVWDVTEKPYRIVYFDWIDGNGKYAPFLNSFRYCIETYHPFYKGIDATGPQQALNELAFENFGIEVDGLKFNRDKLGMLNALKITVQQGNLRAPLIKGLRSQMAAYVLPDKHLAQDTVCAAMMCAWLARYINHQDDDEEVVPVRSSRSRQIGGRRGMRYGRHR